MSGPRFSIMPWWVFTHAGLKPMDIRVLGLLCRHIDKEGWCTRSQVKLAGELTCARSTVQASIDRLVEIGVLVRRPNETADGRDCAHDYRVLFDFDPPEMAAVRPENTEETATPPADISAPPADPLDRHPLPIHGPAPYKNDPLITHPQERIERERAREDLKKSELAFRRAHDLWPTKFSDSAPDALKAWLALDPEARAAAAGAISRYVAAVKAEGRKLVCSFAVYLREKRWDRLPEEAPGVAGGDKAGLARGDVAPPFGPVWGALVLDRLLAGPSSPEAEAAWRETPIFARFKAAWPQLAMIYSEARCGRGVAVGARLKAAAALMEPVPVAGAAFAAWKAAFAARGWPDLPDTGGQQVVYLPKGGPEGLEAFKVTITQQASDHKKGDSAHAA